MKFPIKATTTALQKASGRLVIVCGASSIFGNTFMMYIPYELI